MVHFVLIGALLFVADRWLGEPGPAQGREPIFISSARIEELRATFEETNGVAPTTPQLEALVDEAVVEEILYREARALGLDRDRAVRNRLIQKMRFLEVSDAHDEEQLYRQAAALGLDREDLVVRRILVEKMRRALGLSEGGEAFDQAEIEAYFERHHERFFQDARVAFSHVFLSADRHGERLGAEARSLLSELVASSGGSEPALGDPFPLGRRIGASTRSRLESRFGAPFAEAVFNAEPGHWLGPVRSAYGLHLVRIDERTPARLAPLSSVRNQVVLSLQQERRERRFEERLRRLRTRYEVHIERARS